MRSRDPEAGKLRSQLGPQGFWPGLTLGRDDDPPGRTGPPDQAEPSRHCHLPGADKLTDVAEHSGDQARLLPRMEEMSLVEMSNLLSKLQPEGSAQPHPCFGK